MRLNRRAISIGIASRVALSPGWAAYSRSSAEVGAEDGAVAFDGTVAAGQHHDPYVYSQCLEIDNTIAQCGFCNEQRMGCGDLKFSYRTGCEFCDGANGWEGD